MPISYRAAQTLIKRGDEPALRTALDAGLDPNLTNPNGWSLLMLELGRLLIEKGANLIAINLKGDTPETIATHRGYTAFVALLHEGE
jgi:ankyrin repeat protein